MVGCFVAQRRTLGQTGAQRRFVPSSNLLGPSATACKPETSVISAPRMSKASSTECRTCFAISGPISEYVRRPGDVDGCCLQMPERSMHLHYLQMIWLPTVWQTVVLFCCGAHEFIIWLF